MAATKTRLYNDALRLLADARLPVITDDVESRYALDDAWSAAVEFCLRQASWRFALRTLIPAQSGVPEAGFAFSYAYPDDLLRVHKIFLTVSDGRECPCDLRETATHISTRVDPIYLRYVTNVYANPDATPWPEHFAQVVAAYLAFSVAERVTGERGAAGRMSQLFSQLLAEAARVEAEPDDPWLPYQRTGDLLRGARQVLSDRNWRFALVTSQLTSSGSGIPGYAYGFDKPADWLRTGAIFVGASVAEHPCDARDQDGRLYANVSGITIRYVSKTWAADATAWPEPFFAALLAYFRYRDAAPERTADAAALYRLTLDAASSYTVPDSPWLAHQLSGRFYRATREVLQEGYWAYRDDAGVMHGLREVEYTAADQIASGEGYVFPHRYALPADWFRTAALFIPWDGRECPISVMESEHDWSTDAENFVVRYVTTGVLDATTWPALIRHAVLAYLDWQSAPPEAAKLRAEEYAVALAAAKKAHSRPANDWLQFQLSGAYRAAVQQLLEQGRWRFAVKTAVLTDTTDPLPAEGSDGSAVAGYAYRFIMPNDSMRVLRVYYQRGSGLAIDRYDVDFAEEGDAIHANFTPLTVRYVSRLGFDSPRWPVHFHDAVLAWLQYLAARNDPALAGLAQAKLALFEAACREAERLDDARDRPVILRGRFAAARYRRSPRDREQGWHYQ